MKKRILSIALCLVMVMGLLPIQAFAEEGEECLGSCNHFHWGDAICGGCHLCSADCPKDGGDCWYESHCKECGACYMSADNWCDECGWCQDCMQEAHCQDCGRCFVGESKDELCEDCQRCSDCVDVCLECHKCIECFDEYEHCQSCPTHLVDDAPCGYCDECAEAEGLHCEECGACFEGDAERCPIHEDDPHCKDCAGDYCEECGECEFTKSGLVLCDYCDLCTDCCREKSEAEGCSTGDVCVESPDWDDHFCEECGACFCDDNRCKTCDLCKDCCKNAGICTDCDCNETAGVHHHKYDATKWVVDQNSHWNECRVCHEKVNTAAHKDTDGDGYCDVCGIDQAHPLYISSQPKDLVRKVSNEDLRPFAPSHPNNNRAKFSVTARDMAGRTLNYQWYAVKTNKKTGVKSSPYALQNGVDYVKGATTDTLDIGVPIDGCQYTYQFFCEITATAEDGSSTTITSRYARLKTTHNYSPLDASDVSNISEITVVLDNGNTIVYEQGSLYHNSECIGMNCGRTKLSANAEHTYVFMENLGKGHTADKPSETKYFYREVCTVCAHEDLRASDTEETIPHLITLNAPEGAYAFDVNTEETVTYAKKGAEIMLFAPTLNEHGHVFTGWKVIKGGVTLTANHNPGIYTFYMPTADVELEAQYDSSRHPVESIKINTVKVNGNEVPLVNNTVTVKVGDVIEATAALTPDTDIMDERVLWNVMGTVGDSHTMLHFTGSSGSGILSEPTASPVQLKALKVTGDSKLYLRATAYASKLGTDLKAVSDFIYVNIVADSEHVCEYEVTTVHPTCTLKGYTLYTCKDEECGKSYKTQFTDSLSGHKDTNGDGYCDNLNKNTGKACGFKFSAGGSGDFVGQKKIGKAELTVITPVTGQKPVNAAQSVTSEAYTVASTQWMTADGQALDPNDTFAPFTAYTVKVTLEANTGYAFQLKDFANTKSLRPTAVVKATKFQINKDDTIKPDNGSSKDSVNLLYTFTATEAGTVTPTGEYDFQVLNGTAYDNSTGTKIIDNNIETPVKVPAGTVVKVVADNMDSVGLYFDKWEVVSGGITLADKNSTTTTFTMPENAVRVLAVYERRVNSLSIDKTAATLKVGGEETLTATADPAVYNTEVEWSSSNESVATVNNGKVKAIGVGTATITATIYTKFTTATPEYKSVTCIVTVVPADTPIYTVTVQNDGHGTGTATPASAVAGAEITLSAVADSGYHFKEWKVVSGGVTVTNNKFTMPVDDVTVKAIFEKNSSFSGGSSGGSTAYTVKVLSSKNGSVTADRKTAAKGTTVTLTVSPDKGYALETLTVLDKSGKEIKLTEKNGKYTFTMPASSVEVEAAFKAAKSGNPFVDVPSGSYYEDAVIWAVDKGVTSGTDAAHFSPNGVCTRAQAVTFLWRAAGSPAPKSTAMPFTDVTKGSYYEQAVLWAVENGITKGTSDTTFSPNATCSRAQIVTFLWRSQKSPAAGSVNPFTDVSADAYYADAVLWAVKESVTSGTTATTFSPNADCTRAQIVTFIYRALAE